MAIYKLYPLADPQDPNWDIARNHGEVVVRAKTSGDARLVAAEAEASSARRRNENDDVNSVRASAFLDEKLYGLHQLGESDFDPEGERAVLAGNVSLSQTGDAARIASAGRTHEQLASTGGAKSHAAFDRSYDPAESGQPSAVRDAGGPATRDDKAGWDAVDEAADETFPASDATAKY